MRLLQVSQRDKLTFIFYPCDVGAKFFLIAAKFFAGARPARLAPSRSGYGWRPARTAANRPVWPLRQTARTGLDRRTACTECRYAAASLGLADELAVGST